MGLWVQWFLSTALYHSTTIEHKGGIGSMKKIFLLLALLFLASCTLQQDIVTIKTATNDIEVIVEIADDIDEQALGLMYRTAMEENHGMLFVFSDEKQRVFWMKNTKIPLDIIFVDTNGIIVDIKENFEPCIVSDCEKYYSKPALYALEVNAGFVAEYEITVGDILVVR
jgi:uncharacterized membrane protein (UPF0127 family)